MNPVPVGLSRLPLLELPGWFIIMNPVPEQMPLPELPNKQTDSKKLPKIVQSIREDTNTKKKKMGRTNNSPMHFFRTH